MELIEKLKEYIKVLEKARDMYAGNYWRSVSAKSFTRGIGSGKIDCVQACINDLKKMIDETEAHV